MIEYRISRIIKDYGNITTNDDVPAVYSALQECINYNLEDVSNEDIKDCVMSLVKCDSCETYEIDIFVTRTSLILDDQGNEGMMCDFCRGNG